MPHNKGVASRLVTLGANGEYTQHPELSNINLMLFWADWHTAKNVFNAAQETSLINAIEDAHTHGYTCGVRLEAGSDGPIGRPGTAQASWMNTSWPAGDATANDNKAVNRIRTFDNDSSSDSNYRRELYVPDWVTAASYANLRYWYNIAVDRLVTVLTANDTGGHTRFRHVAFLSTSLPTENGTEMSLGYGSLGPTGFTGAATLVSTYGTGALATITLGGTYGTYPTGPALLKVTKASGVFEYFHQHSRAGAVVTLASRAFSGTSAVGVGSIDITNGVQVDYANANITYGDFNNYPSYSSTLSATITSGATSLSVASATGMSSAPFVIQIDSERILVGAASGTTLLTLTRGYDGTAAASHTSGAVVQEVAPFDHQQVNSNAWTVLGTETAIKAATKTAWQDNFLDIESRVPSNVLVELAGGSTFSDGLANADLVVEAVGPTKGPRMLAVTTNLQDGYLYPTTHPNEYDWLTRAKNYGAKLMLQTAAIAKLPNTQAGTQELIDSMEWGTAVMGADILEIGGARLDLTGVFTTTASGTLGGGWPGGTVGQKDYLLVAPKNIQSRMLAVATLITATDKGVTAESSSVNKLTGGLTKSASEAAVVQETSSVSKTVPPLVGAWFDPEQFIPTYEITVTYNSSIPAEVATRVLNGTNPGDAIADTIEFGDVMPGGFATFSCYIPFAEYNTVDGKKAYRFMATLTVKIAPGWPGAGLVLYQGYVKTPVPQPDGRVQIFANGWIKLLEERDQDLLFVDEGYSSWQDTGSDPYGPAFSKGDSVQSDVKTASLRFSVDKGQQIAAGDSGRIAWYFQDHYPNRIEFDIEQNTVVPAPGTGGDLYALRLEKFDGVGAPGTSQTIKEYTAALRDTSTEKITENITTSGKPVISLGLTVLRNLDPTGSRFIVTLRNIKVYELATSYNFDGWDVMNVLAGRVGATMGAKTSKLLPTGAGVPGMMPLWWQNGTWMELAEYVASAYAFKVAFWEGTGLDNLGPIDVEYRSWLGATTWVVNAYGAQSFAVPDLVPSDDVYTQVEVTYTLRGSRRLRRAKSPVLVLQGAVYVSPFSGLPRNRERTYRLALQDTQPNGDLALKLADILAKEYGAEQFSGTLELSYVTDASGNKVSATRVRSGDQVQIADFPGGSKVLRVTETRKTETSVTLSLGRIPTGVERLLFWDHKRLMRTGKISSSPG